MQEGDEIKITITSKIKRGTQKSEMHQRGRTGPFAPWRRGRIAFK